ncbi:MAG: S41 family peptidase [Gemmatimonadaceae bacterium]
MKVRRAVNLGRALCLAAAFVPLGAGLCAQAESAIDATTRVAVIDASLTALKGQYIFPEVAARIEQDLRSRLQRGEYDTVRSGPAFAALLTTHMQGVSHDKHMSMEWSPSVIPDSRGGATPRAPSPQRKERERRQSAYNNFGFQRVERLRGNIGYLQLSYFDRPEFAGDAVTSAMEFLRHTDALIIDLRDNDGGRPEMVALLISYLVKKPTALTGIYWRQSGHVDSAATVAVPDSLKYLQKEVYLLTSNTGTISAGEAFVYDLHLLRRATIVGEVSAGAANPGGFVRVGDHFQLFVPRGRAVSPISGTNWEGVGIAPDIAVNADAALQVAELQALKRLAKQATDADRKEYLMSVIGDMEKKPH